MNTLISPTEVLRRAFRGHERLPADLIREADIVSVEWCFVRPIFGDALHDRLLLGADAAFVTDFLADAVALLCRYRVLPRMMHHCTMVGLLRPHPSESALADVEALSHDRRAAKQEAITLLRRAVRYVEAHAADFPEYDPDNNVLNHCSTDGGFVQIH